MNWTESIDLPSGCLSITFPMFQLFDPFTLTTLKPHVCAYIMRWFFSVLIRLESNDFSTAEHMGTHIDAPAHLYKGAKRLDEIPLEDLIAPLVIIDVRAQVARTSFPWQILWLLLSYFSTVHSIFVMQIFSLPFSNRPKGSATTRWR